MPNGSEYSPLECSIINAQIARRAAYRREFLRKKSDPCMHSKEAGYVFDEAIQRFTSMKVTQLDHFQTNRRTTFFGIFTVVIPMFVYGTLVYLEREKRESDIRAGIIKYRDRRFKFQ